MINVEWRNVAHGFDYKKYLQRQVQDVLDDLVDDPKMAYYAKSGEFSLTNLTRISGALSDRFLLQGPATLEKLEMISEMELGEHPEIKKNLRIKTKKKYILNHPDIKSNLEIKRKDIKNGWIEVDGNKIHFTKDQFKEEIVTNRRSSLELIFSLDKSFSYLFFSDKLSLEDKKILQELIFEAKNKTMEEIIVPMLVTANGQRGELLFYDFMHLDNREQDPHLHIHSNISNLIRLPNGSYKVIEPRELFKHGTAERVDFQFKSIVLKLMQERLPNVPIEAYDKDFQAVEHKGSQVSEIKDFRIAFHDETTKEIRSKYTHDKKIKEQIDADKKNAYQRSQNFLSELKSNYDHGKFSKQEYLNEVKKINESYQNEYTHLSSRKYNKIVQRTLVNKKEIISLHEKQDQLVQKTSEINIQLKSPSEIKPIRFAYTDEHILENLTNRSPKFTRNDLIRDIAKYRGLGVEAQHVADSIIKKNSDIFALPRKSKNSNSANDQPIFTLRSLAELEHENMLLLEKISKQQHSHYEMGTAINLAQHLHKITFKDEQADYIENVFSNHGVSLVVGLPGTGKSFAMKHAVAMAKTQQRMTYGLAPTGKVSSAIMDEAGTDYAATIDKFLIDIRNGKVVLKADDLVFVDEAGMIGTRNYNLLLLAVEQSGAKLVLIGDNNQLDPVSAGNTFNEFIKEHAAKPYTSILSEISRQKNLEALKIAQAVSGQSSMANHGGTAQEQLRFWQTDREAATHTKEAFDLLETFGQVQQYDTSKDMLEDVMKKFTNLQESYDQKILLASTNNTVNALNFDIQAQRLKNGELGRSLVVNAESVYVNDRIVILKNNKEVKNGDFGTVIDITKDGMLLVKFDNNKIKSINPETTKINLGYAMTVHKSQGITKSQTFHVGEVSQLNNAQLFNVAATRNTQHYNFFAVKSEYEAIKESYCRASDKISLLDVRNIIKNTQENAAKPSIKFDNSKINAKKEKLEASKKIELEQSKIKINSPEEFQKVLKRIKLEQHYTSNPAPRYHEMAKRLVDKYSCQHDEAMIWIKNIRKEIKISLIDMLGSMKKNHLRGLIVRGLLNDKIEQLFTNKIGSLPTPEQNHEIKPFQHKTKDQVLKNIAAINEHGNHSLKHNTTKPM